MNTTSLDFEAVLDTSPDAGEPADAPEEAVAEAPEVEAAPEPETLTMEQVQELLDQREAEIMHRVQAGQQPPPAQQGEEVNWAEVMNPLSDEYDPQRFFAARDDYLLGQMKELVAPILSREQQSQQQAGQQYVDQFVENRWQENLDGPLTKEARDGINALIPTFLQAANEQYGVTDVAAREALNKATETVRQINRAARANGAQSNIDQLAAIANAAGEPGSNGGGAINVAPQPASLEELNRKWFGPQPN